MAFSALTIAALALQLLLPLWHALELQGHCTEGTACVVSDRATTPDRHAEQSSPHPGPYGCPAQGHDESTCPTCQQIFFAKSFGTPTLIAVTNFVESAQWRRELVLVEQIRRIDIQVELSPRAPPHC